MSNALSYERIVVERSFRNYPENFLNSMFVALKRRWKLGHFRSVSNVMWMLGRGPYPPKFSEKVFKLIVIEGTQWKKWGTSADVRVRMHSLLRMPVDIADVRQRKAIFMEWLEGIKTRNKDIQERKEKLMAALNEFPNANVEEEPETYEPFAVETVDNENTRLYQFLATTSKDQEDCFNAIKYCLENNLYMTSNSFDWYLYIYDLPLQSARSVKVLIKRIVLFCVSNSVLWIGLGEAVQKQMARRMLEATLLETMLSDVTSYDIQSWLNRITTRNEDIKARVQLFKTLLEEIPLNNSDNNSNSNSNNNNNSNYMEVRWNNIVKRVPNIVKQELKKLDDSSCTSVDIETVSGFDLIMYDEVSSVAEYLKNKENTAFVLPDGSIFCFEKASVIDFLADFTNKWMYECDDIPIKGTNNKRVKAKNPDMPYLAFPIDKQGMNGFIPVGQVLTMLDMDHQLFFIKPQTVNGDQVTFTHTATWKNVLSKLPDYVSANHCQFGSNIMIYDLCVCKQLNDKVVGGRKKKKTNDTKAKGRLKKASKVK